jgi:putative ABC transport system ATP-binding protein
MNEHDPIIDVRHVVKTFDEGRTRALAGATLQVWPGEFVALTGPSGCGKSTLLHLIAALDKPDEGTITVAGTDLLKTRDLSGYRARTVGLIFQLHNLLPHLTAAENVQVPMYETRLSARQRREKARDLLRLVDLADKANRRPPELSGGERQRVAIARALANDPPIVLADEPTGSLDSRAGERVLALLREIQHQRGVTLLLVTHNRDIAATADRVVQMLDGRILGEAEEAANAAEVGEAAR